MKFGFSFSAIMTIAAATIVIHQVLHAVLFEAILLITDCSKPK